MLPEPIAVTLQVIEALEACGVRYVIGGWMASAVNGFARATMDSDLVADIRPDQVNDFVRSLGQDFYADVDSILSSVQRRVSFSVIHLKTMFKVDIFPSHRPFDDMQLARRVSRQISTNPDQAAYVLSAEDIVLAKLDWFRRGGEVSDRQWLDIIGILKVQSRRLDHDYLRDWATALGVPDLLERAVAEA